MKGTKLRTGDTTGGELGGGLGIEIGGAGTEEVSGKGVEVEVIAGAVVGEVAMVDVIITTACAIVIGPKHGVFNQNLIAKCFKLLDISLILVTAILLKRVNMEKGCHSHNGLGAELFTVPAKGIGVVIRSRPAKVSTAPAAPTTAP